MFLRGLRAMAPFVALASTALPLYCSNNPKKTVYLWGNGVYQARPDALLQFQNFTPKRMQNLPQNIRSVEFGQYYEAGIDDSGVLWVWKTQKLDSNLNKTSQTDYERQGISKLAKNVKEAKFTTGYLWTLTDKKEVIQYPLVKDIDKQTNKVKSCSIGKPRTVKPLNGSVQICCGDDHLISLTQKGDVMAMGDDTFGQCGTNDTKRPSFPPFQEHRVSYPIKVPFLKNIKKISAGGNHCLALDDSGSLYGWGSNSNLQLSHEQQFSQMNTPLICSFKPIKISKGLDNTDIIDMKAGEEFSIILGQNKLNNSFEVYSVGSNLKGQLGLGEIRHVRDITKIEALSNFVMKRGGKAEPVQVKQVACGRGHCIAWLNINYVMEWGDNEHGQMGNKKRSAVYTPIIVKQFSKKDILGVFAGQNCSGVIVNEKEQDKKKKS